MMACMLKCMDPVWMPAVYSMYGWIISMLLAYVVVRLAYRGIKALAYYIVDMLYE